MAEISAGNLYDMNKMLVAQAEKQLKGKALFNKFKNTVVPYFSTHNNEYFMMLCHDRRDYTVFVDSSKSAAEKLANELKECLLNRGKIFAIDKTEDGIALEIWIQMTVEKMQEGIVKEETEMFCYYLFPYDEAIVKV